MPTSPNISWQPSLLEAIEDPRIDEAFSGVTRIELDPASWVDYQPGWVSGSDRLFAELVAGTEWGQRSRHIYERVVEEPRLTSWWSRSSGRTLAPPVLERMRAVLSGRYGVEFDSMGLNLYRDGRDSVAWHGDKIPKQVEEPLVAIVSIGEPRRFLLRPREGKGTKTFLLGRGDLLVTGGLTQRRWLHSVPKVAQAGPRISITFRHGVPDRVYSDDAARDGNGGEEGSGRREEGKDGERYATEGDD